MKNLIYSVICMLAITSTSQAGHLSCDVIERTGPNGTPTASREQYKLEGDGEGNVALLAWGKSLKVGFEVLGSSDLMTLDLTINGSSDNPSKVIIEAKGNELFYVGPINQGYLELDCKFQPK